MRGGVVGYLFLFGLIAAVIHQIRVSSRGISHLATTGSSNHQYSQLRHLSPRAPLTVVTEPHNETHTETPLPVVEREEPNNKATTNVEEDPETVPDQEQTSTSNENLPAEEKPSNLDENDQTPDRELSPAEKLEKEKKEAVEWGTANLDLEIATWNYFPDIMPAQSVKEPTLKLDPTKCPNLELDTSPPKKRPPSNGTCDGYAGILHIEHGDFGGASGTIFFQFMVGFLQWADQHNFKPWVHMNDVSHPVFDEVVHNQGPNTEIKMMAGMGIGWARDARDPVGYKFPGRPRLQEDDQELVEEVFDFKGTGIWEHYFEPVSDFSPGDPSCVNKPLVKMKYDHIMPGLHSHAPFVSRPWRYWMPEYIRRSNETFAVWFKPQRKRAAEATKRYIRFNAAMEQRAACAHPNTENSLGMHIRHGDKESSRDYIKVADFLPFCEAFVDTGGGDIYLATDSGLVVEKIMRDWPKRVSSHIVRQPAVEGLSRNDTAAFSLGISTHRTNVEALTDALAMSKCTYLLHGMSALSEAAFFINPGLTERAINLEDFARDETRDREDKKYFENEILPRGRKGAKNSTDY